MPRAIFYVVRSRLSRKTAREYIVDTSPRTAPSTFRCSTRMLLRLLWSIFCAIKNGLYFQIYNGRLLPNPGVKSRDLGMREARLRERPAATGAVALAIGLAY